MTRYSLLFLLLTALCGCGLKGPLYHPTAPQQGAQEEATASETGSADSGKLTDTEQP